MPDNSYPPGCTSQHIENAHGESPVQSCDLDLLSEYLIEQNGMEEEISDLLTDAIHCNPDAAWSFLRDVLNGVEIKSDDLLPRLIRVRAEVMHREGAMKWKEKEERMQ